MTGGVSPGAAVAVGLGGAAGTSPPTATTVESVGVWEGDGDGASVSRISCGWLVEASRLGRLLLVELVVSRAAPARCR